MEDAEFPKSIFCIQCPPWHTKTGHMKYETACQAIDSKDVCCLLCSASTIHPYTLAILPVMSAFSWWVRRWLRGFDTKIRVNKTCQVEAPECTEKIWSQVQGEVRVGIWGKGVGRNHTTWLTSSQSSSLFIQNSIGVSIRVYCCEHTSWPRQLL